MKVINIGNTYEVYDETLKVFDELPPMCYIVRFSKMRGFFLEKYDDISVSERAYGVHDDKVAKVIKSFRRTPRSLGVILSGNKGIGKSFFAKMLSDKANKESIPVIVVDRYIPGIANYIEEISQEVMVLFDEFDKTFGKVKQAEGAADAQTEMLTLFDGVSQGKKLFVITCNELDNLNDYLVNRPGRFHYHFRFDYPSAKEIEEYLRDKLDEKYYDQISAVVSFSNRMSLNYDCLRAIAFELESDVPFNECIKDLNIVNINASRYIVTLAYDNGVELVARNARLDLSDTMKSYTYMYDEKNRDIVTCCFVPAHAKYSDIHGCYTIPIERVAITYDDDYDKADVDYLKSLTPSYLTIRLEKSKSLHYIL